jgi:hypothetical protein
MASITTSSGLRKSRVTQVQRIDNGRFSLYSRLCATHAAKQFRAGRNTRSRPFSIITTLSKYINRPESSIRRNPHEARTVELNRSESPALVPNHLNMLFSIPFKVLLLALTAIISATPTAQPPALQVFNLGAFLSNNPQIPSHIAFHVRDARPEHYLDIDCTFLASDANPSIWTDGWTACDDEFQVAFWMQRDSLRLRRAVKGGDDG